MRWVDGGVKILLGILRSAHTVYLCVLCRSENKQRLFPYTALTDWLVFTTETKCVYCVVRTGCLNIIQLDGLSSGYIPGVWVLKADVSEHCVGSIFNRWWSVKFITCWRWNRHGVPKRRLLILRRRGNTQKTIYHYNNMTKVWKIE
jgi:hypothetical protein